MEALARSVHEHTGDVTGVDGDGQSQTGSSGGANSSGYNVVVDAVCSCGGDTAGDSCDRADGSGSASAVATHEDRIDRRHKVSLRLIELIHSGDAVGVQQGGYGGRVRVNQIQFRQVAAQSQGADVFAVRSDLIFTENNRGVIQVHRGIWSVGNGCTGGSCIRAQSLVPNVVAVKAILPSTNHRQLKQLDGADGGLATAQHLSVEDGGSGAEHTAGRINDEVAGGEVSQRVRQGKGVLVDYFHPVRAAHQFGGSAYEVGGLTGGSQSDRLGEEDALTAAQAVAEAVEGSAASGNNGSSVGGDRGCRVQESPAHPVQDVGLGRILQSTGQVQSVYTGNGTRDVLDQIGSLTVDVYFDIPVRISVADEGKVTRGGGHVNCANGGLGDEVGTFLQNHIVVNVRGVYSVGGQKNVVQAVVGVSDQIARSGDHEHFCVGDVLNNVNVLYGEGASAENGVGEGKGLTRLIAVSTISNGHGCDDTTGDYYCGEKARATHSARVDSLVGISTVGQRATHSGDGVDLEDGTGDGRVVVRETTYVYCGEVAAYAASLQGNLLDGQSYGPIGGVGQLEHTAGGGSHSVDGVLSGIQKTYLDAVRHNVGRLVDSSLSRLTKHDGLVGELRIANVVTDPLVNGVVNKVLATFVQVRSGFVRGVLGVLVDVSYKERTGVSQGHPLVVVALAVSSSGGTHKGTAFCVKLGISGRGDQVALVLLAVECCCDALGVVLGHTYQIYTTAHNVLNVVCVLHEHEVATHGQNFGHYGHIAIESGGGDGNEAVLGVGELDRIQVVQLTEATNIDGATDGRVALDGLGNSGCHGCGDPTVVGLVTSNVGNGDGYGNTQVLAVGGETGGAIASNQRLTIDVHLHVHLVSSLQRGGKVGAVELGCGGEELEFNDLIRSSYAHNAQVTYAGVLEELIYAIIAQEGDTALGNCGSANTNQLLIVIEGGDCDWGVEGEPSYGHAFLSLDQHVYCVERSNSGNGEFARLLVDVYAGSSGSYPASPEGKSCHFITGMFLLFRRVV